jgi:hypothetical protein
MRRICVEAYGKSNEVHENNLVTYIQDARKNKLYNKQLVMSILQSCKKTRFMHTLFRDIILECMSFKCNEAAMQIALINALCFIGNGLGKLTLIKIIAYSA